MASNYKRQDLDQLIQDVTGYPVTPSMNKQITNFVLNQDMTWKEIAQCIVWYVEVAQKEISPIYGLGFVQNVRPQAAEYFRKLALEQQKKDEEADKIVEYQENNIIFNIKLLEHKKRKPKHLDIGEIIIKGDDKDESSN